MGLVDVATALRARALDRLLPQRFVFHHVPKCGGTSVGRALRRRYLLSQATVTPEDSFRAFEAFTGRSDRERMLVDVLDLREQMLLYHMFRDVRGLSLHVRFSEAAYSRFADRYKFVTILREPVARFLSHYNWSHGRDGAHARIDEGFGAFLGTERARRMGASYVEYFCGLPKDADIRSGQAIGRAIDNLARFSVVGFLDDLPGFRAALRRTLRARVRIGHENRTAEGRRSISAPALSDADMARVRELCAPDLAVWEAAQAFRSAPG